MNRANEQIPIDYVLMQTAGRYRIKDVKAAGVSMIANYHNAFSRMIKKEGYQGLIRNMKLQTQAIEKG